MDYGECSGRVVRKIIMNRAIRINNISRIVVNELDLMTPSP